MTALRLLRAYGLHRHLLAYPVAFVAVLPLALFCLLVELPVDVWNRWRGR